MDHRLASLRKWLHTQKITVLWLIPAAGLVVLVGLVLAGAGTGLPGTAQAAPLWQPLLQEPMPTYNWFVCGDLGLGTVPGVPGLVQRLELCHRQGWRLLAYCLEPEKPAPPLGTSCARTNADTFWCGDEFQLLREYQIAETPTPGPGETPTGTPTDTPLPTETFTPTALPSSTPTASQTASPFPTETSTATATATATITPPLGTIPPAEITITPTPFGGGSPGPSPTPRTPPGGQGNLLLGSLALLMSTAALVAAATSAAVLFWWRRQP